jgi:hypothetical protein
MTPLDPSTLSPAAQKALGPGPGRMMAARGMLPLSPADQLAVLYQLSLDGEAAVASAARATATALPERLLLGTLADPALDPRVLEMFATLVVAKPALVGVLLLNPAIGDPTVATLAARGDAGQTDQIAQNEQRLLRHPEIIAALYLNPKARTSTVDRVIELAVRNQVRVPGLAAWDEVAAALAGAKPATPEVDALFAAAAEELAVDDGTEIEQTEDGEHIIPEAKKPMLDKLFLLPVNDKVRLASMGNAFTRAALIKDPIKVVAMAAIKAPGIRDTEVIKYVKTPAVCNDVIEYIAARGTWTKDLKVKVALCFNPKTPIAAAAKLLPFLQEKQLKELSKARGVPSALAAQAKRLLQSRMPGAGK